MFHILILIIIIWKKANYFLDFKLYKNLKELFIKTINETLKSIEKESREIYKKKLEVFTQLQRFTKKEKEIRKYILVVENIQKRRL